jgi:hypothetical protein
MRFEPEVVEGCAETSWEIIVLISGFENTWLLVSEAARSNDTTYANKYFDGKILMSIRQLVCILEFVSNWIPKNT